MRLSTGLMARGRMGEPDVLAGIGAAAEEAGLHRVWFGDHVVYPVEFAPRHPYGDGRLPYNPASPQLDAVVAMTWLLAGTRRIGVGTFVMVIGLRQPVWLAKQLASLDRLSRGRVALGVGTGWLTEEYTALGVSPARRGARTDDCIQVLRKLWTEPTPEHASGFVNFPALHCNPKPAQDGGIPIWIGGHGDAALPRLRALAERHGRDPAAIGVATTVNSPDPATVRDRLPRLRDLGVTEAVVPVQGKSPEAVAEWIAGIPDLLED